MDFIPVEDDNPPLLNYVQCRNIELKLGAAPNNIYFYSRKIIDETRFPNSNRPIVGEEYIFRNLILKKKPTTGKVRTKILHYHNPRFQWLIRRCWKYGRWFSETKKHLSAKENVDFISYNSIFKSASLRRLPQALNGKPHLIFPFMLYILVKYLSFAIGYIAGIL